ncbi:MAG: DUF5703 family protein, partial [Dermatophilaceae bacterium]
PLLTHNMAMPFGTAVEYEYLVLVFGRETARDEIRRALTDHAEYGHWELARTRTYMGGSTRTWLRRRIIRPRGRQLSRSR